MNYYSVHKGTVPGIYNNWNECKSVVNGYKGAVFKKFTDYEEAENFLKNGKNSKKNNDKIESIDKYIEKDTIYVYTDGSCINNGMSNAKAGIGIFFKDNDKRNVSSVFDGLQTNNIAELKAIYKVLSILKKEISENKHIIIYSDSKYAIRCFTEYGEKLSKNNWSENVPNLDLIKECYTEFSKKKNIKLIHIKAHTNKKDIHSYGNSQADNLAYKAIQL